MSNANHWRNGTKCQMPITGEMGQNVIGQSSDKKTDCQRPIIGEMGRKCQWLITEMSVDKQCKTGN